MEPTTSQPQKNRRTLWIIVAGVILLLVIVGVVIAVSMANTKKSDTTASNTSSSSTVSPTPAVATKDQVIKQLDSLGSSIKQLASDQTAAKNALKDNERQIKVTK